MFDADTEEDINTLFELRVPIVQQATNAYRELTGDSEFLRLTWMLEDAKHNEASALANAEKKGIQIGEQRGIELTKLETARNAINYGLDDATVAMIAGISTEQARSLRVKK